MRASKLSFIATTIAIAALDMFLAVRILLDRRELETEVR